MADWTIEQFTNFDMDDVNDDFYAPPKILRCRSCGKRHLFWRKILDKWILTEADDSVHVCKGYNVPLDVLKEVAAEAQRKIKQEAEWKAFEKAKKRGSLTKMMPTLTNDELIGLYGCFVRDEQCHKSNPDVGMFFGYQKQIDMLKAEILKRMK